LQEDNVRLNEEITHAQVRLVDHNGDNLGIVELNSALSLADQAGLDLVEVSSHVTPPVCKIMDHGKFRYDKQKRVNEAKKKQKITTVKEIKLRPTIGNHDYEIKIRNAMKFLEHGDKVKFTLRFRGREVAHIAIGSELMDRVVNDLEEHSKIESSPKLEGKQMTLIIAPKA